MNLQKHPRLRFPERRTAALITDEYGSGVGEEIDRLKVANLRLARGCVINGERPHVQNCSQRRHVGD